MSEPGYPLYGYEVPASAGAPPPSPNPRRPLTVTVAAGLALLQTVLLAVGALFCLGVVTLAAQPQAWSQLHAGESASTVVWMFSGLGLANAVLMGGFGVAFRQTLTQGRLWLFLSTVANTGLSLIWLASPSTITVDFKLAYLVIPLAAASFASHRLSNAFYRDRSARTPAG